MPVPIGPRAAMEVFNLDEGTVITTEKNEDERADGVTIRYVPLWGWLLSV